MNSQNQDTWCSFTLSIHNALSLLSLMLISRVPLLCGIKILTVANIPILPGRKIQEHASVSLQATFIFMLQCSKE